MAPLLFIFLKQQFMDTKKEQVQQAGGGSGSAEQTGRDREEQRLPTTETPEERRQNIASQIGESESRVSSINELGGLSGRDDSSGGSGDRMEEQNSGDATDR
jgi:hypothetical protein